MFQVIKCSGVLQGWSFSPLAELLLWPVNKNLRPNIVEFVLDINSSHCEKDYSLHQHLQTFQQLTLDCLCTRHALLCSNGGHSEMHSTLHCRNVL